MADLRPVETLLTADQIEARVAEMAAEIRRDFPDGLHLVAVLKGAFMFLSDLVRHMEGHVSLDFMALSSYAKGTTTSGEVRLLKDLDTTLDGKNVVIVEDIVDTGLTLMYLQDILRARGPKALRTACLLSKPSRRASQTRTPSKPRAGCAFRLTRSSLPPGPPGPWPGTAARPPARAGRWRTSRSTGPRGPRSAVRPSAPGRTRMRARPSPTAPASWSENILVNMNG